MRNIDVTIVKIRIFNISPPMPDLRFSNTQVYDRLAAERGSIQPIVYLQAPLGVALIEYDNTIAILIAFTNRCNVSISVPLYLHTTGNSFYWFAS